MKLSELSEMQGFQSVIYSPIWYFEFRKCDLKNKVFLFRFHHQFRQPECQISLKPKEVLITSSKRRYSNVRSMTKFLKTQFVLPSPNTSGVSRGPRGQGYHRYNSTLQSKPLSYKVRKEDKNITSLLATSPRRTRL